MDIPIFMDLNLFYLAWEYLRVHQKEIESGPWKRAVYCSLDLGHLCNPNMDKQKNNKMGG